MTFHSLRLALRFLRGGGARHLLTVVAIACGVALVCAVDVANRGVLAAFGQVLDTMGGRAALQVTSGGGGGTFPMQIADRVAAVPGVLDAVPVVAGTAFLADGSGELLTVHGMDIAKARVVGIYEPPSQERFRSANPAALGSTAILITRALAARRHLTVGSLLSVDTPAGRRQFMVGGLLEPFGIGSVVGEGLAVMGLATAQAAFARPGFVNRVDIVLAADADRDRLAAAIAAVLPADMRVDTPAQRQADLQRSVHALQRVLQAVGVLALIEAFLLVFNSLATSFNRRSWQLGILQAIGIRPRLIRRTLVVESLLLGAAGAMVGIPLGIVLGRMLLPWVAAASALNAAHLAPPAELAVRGVSLALAAGLGLAAAALAAVLPARRAVVLGAAAVIRTRGIEQPPVSRRWTRLAGLLTVTIAIAVIAVAQEVTQDGKLGLVVTALVALATVLAARPLCTAALRVFGPGLRVFAGPSGGFAAVTLERTPQRTAITVAALAIGVGSVLWFKIVAWSFERTVIDAYAYSTRADLVISSPHVAKYVQTLAVDGELASAAQAIPGVAKVAGNRVVDWQHAGGPIAIDAYDAAYFTRLAPEAIRFVGGHWPGAWERAAAGEAVLVSSNFVYNIGAHTGDTLTLSTPSGPMSLPIAGVVSAFSSARGTVIISRDVYSRLWHDSSLTRIFTMLERGADSAAVATAIARRLGGTYQLQSLSGVALVEYFAAQVRRAFAGLNVIAVLVLGMVLLATADTLSASVMERAPELGALRAVGVRRDLLRRMVVVEALALGTVGLLLGAVVGVALGAFWAATTFSHLLGWVLDLHVPYAWVVLILLLALGACLLGAWLPARQVARLEPAAALRYE